MNEKELLTLFDKLHPHFFESADIRGLDGSETFDEMIMLLDRYDAGAFTISIPDDITFGFFGGDTGELQKTVAKVDKDWTEYFDGQSRVYCAYAGGRIVSFCIADDMGTFDICGRTFRVGGPGCVGTIPEYRGRGIGLALVKNMTGILKDEGVGISYIHYTAVADWYAKLGYRTVIKWNRNGIEKTFPY